MKIISIRQPWASLIVAGVKDIENRTWSTRYRGPVLVHASQRTDRVSGDEILARFGVRLPADLQTGGVVGITEIVDCVSLHASKWFAGPFGFVLKDSCELPFVRFPGALSLRTAPPELLRATPQNFLTLQRRSTRD